MNHIDTIIFDLGGVLIDWRPMNVYLKAFDGDEKKARWFLNNVCTASWNASLDKGKNWQEALDEKIAEFPQFEKQIRLYHNEWELMLNGEISESVEIFKKLKTSAKYRLYSITNWNTETFKITQAKYSFLNWFDAIEVSGHLKMIKPDKEIYLHTIKKYGITPKNSIFIDDNQANIATANNLGINGILFINPGQLRNKLLDFKIEI